ncbi:hypothetical protein E1A91_D07G008300v1 [Gossypium mustelinum]|uniref:Uncharacterized protein n=1 Tax=Gossypium mustelinum TaxID=34275 RepID=A0A5D2U539_GOSMU|nr:hypothetical protein E1A91_D07G008300v1 [Gossypium mustelinum]
MKGGSLFCSKVPRLRTRRRLRRTTTIAGGRRQATTEVF